MFFGPKITTRLILGIIGIIFMFIFKKLIIKLIILGLLIFLAVRFIKKRKGLGLPSGEASDNDNANNNNVNVNVVNQLPSNDDESHAFTRKN
jgi:hypothetical protein